MKKIISMFLAACMILALSACGSNGSASNSGGSAEPSVTGQQPESTKATIAANDPGTESTTEPATETTTEPTTEPTEPADPYSVAYGTWYEQNGQVATLNEDGTFILDGVTYTYTFEEVYGDTIPGMIYDGDEELYILRITKDSDYGYHTLMIRPANKSGQYTGFYNRDEFDVIEMTLDNWDQYFDLYNEPAFTLDENGNVTDFKWDAYLVLKEDLSVCFNASSVVFSCKSTYAYRYVTIDTADQTVTTGDLVYPD